MECWTQYDSLQKPPASQPNKMWGLHNPWYGWGNFTFGSPLLKMIRTNQTKLAKQSRQTKDLHNIHSTCTWEVRLTCNQEPRTNHEHVATTLGPLKGQEESKAKGFKQVDLLWAGERD